MYKFIVEMELMQGARNKQELQLIKKKMERFWILPMNNQIANLASQLIDVFSLSHNIKDFRYIQNLILYTEKT